MARPMNSTFSEVCSCIDGQSEPKRTQMRHDRCAGVWGPTAQGTKAKFVAHPSLRVPFLGVLMMVHPKLHFVDVGIILDRRSKTFGVRSGEGCK